MIYRPRTVCFAAAPWVRSLGRGMAAIVMVWAVGCDSPVEVDPGEGVETLAPFDGPTLEMNPAGAVLPFPHDLLRPAGMVTLPAQCEESAAATALREMTLNALDGFGAFDVSVRLTFTATPDFASLQERVFLYPLVGEGEPVPEPVPVRVFPSSHQRFAGDCSTSERIDAVSIVPTRALAQGRTHVAVVLSGVSTDGQPFLPSATWSLIRQRENPVTVRDGEIISHRTSLDPSSEDGVASLLGLDALYRFHLPALALVDRVLGRTRDEILLAVPFTTQTITAPLDPNADGSPAAQLDPGSLTDVRTLLIDPGTGLPTLPVSTFFQNALGVDAATCTALGCDAVDDVFVAQVSAPRYSTERFNGTLEPTPGAWTDPYAPLSSGDDALRVLLVVPTGTAPVDGFPVIVFGHGIGRAKEDMLAIAPQLAAAGFVSAAIDWVNHGSRAVLTSTAAELGCAGGSLDPTGAPQCFEPILSADLAVTRDNLRQSALDAMALRRALAACDTCLGPSVDASRIGYLGQSLGAIIGTSVVAMDEGFAASVLNVGGAGLVDVIENTESLTLRCSLVDALIAAGILLGEPLDVVDGTGLCTTDSWRTTSAWRSFRDVASWVLDPADAANFAARLAGRSVLLQDVEGDSVVPNLTSAQLAAQAGVDEPTLAAVATNAAPLPSRDATSTDQFRWLRYVEAPPSSGFAGNRFAHGSLLVPPSPATCFDTTACLDGQLGTAQMQTDAITFLQVNLVR